MKAFWTAMVTMVIISGIAAVVLESLPFSAEESFSTGNVRLN